MKASTLVICRDERSAPCSNIRHECGAPRTVFAYDTLGLAQGDTGPNRAEPEGNGPPKGRAKSLAAFGAVVDNNWGGGMTDGRGKAAPGAGDTHRGLAFLFGGTLGGTLLTS